MMSFNDLLARRSKHRGKKRKRSEEKALKDAKKSNVEAVPTLDDAIHTIQSSLSVSPTTNTNTSSMKSLTNSILYVGVLAGANFPHQELWESCRHNHSNICTPFFGSNQLLYFFSNKLGRTNSHFFGIGCDIDVHYDEFL